MIAIRPVYTSYEREEYMKPFGIVPKEGFHVIAAHNDGRFVGGAYVSFEGKNGTIHLMSLIDGYDDYIDRFLIGKAALNFLDLSGAKNVEYTGSDEKLAKALGFKFEDGKITINLEGYFDGNHEGCSGHCSEEK
ncbi:MAG: hypothetical protein IJW06_00360 [Clostridia bacterium]|nr:hypothetical protein [Clostridia bacterium]